MTDLFNTSPTLVKILSALPPEQRAEAFRLVLEDESLLRDLFDSPDTDDADEPDPSAPSLPPS
jgi:hypothetical protein